MLNGAYSNINIYKNALNGTWERNKAISNNIANENTPKYKRKVVSFEDQLKDSIKSNQLDLKTTNKKHIKIGTSEFSPIITTDKSTSYRIDGNNVNMDRETGELAKNTIMYNALIEQVTNDFRKIKNVIQEGSK